MGKLARVRSYECLVLAGELQEAFLHVRRTPLPVLPARDLSSYI